MIIGDVLLIIEGILIAVLVNPLSIIVSEVNILFKILYFLCHIFGWIVLVVGIRDLKTNIHKYLSTRKKQK